MTLNDIKTKWNSEKGFYRRQEVGTGVQSFIKACLESEALFALKEGSLSSKPDSRHNEFIHEHKAKEGRRADFVLYITGSSTWLALLFFVFKTSVRANLAPSAGSEEKSS